MNSCFHSFSFRYASGDQREGFFLDNILDGQVIFTKVDGTTVIETWSKGEKVEDNTKTEKDVIPQIDSNNVTPEDVESNSVDIISIVSRGGSRGSVWGKVAEKPKSGDDPAHGDLISRVRTRSRSFLFEIYSGVN